MESKTECRFVEIYDLCYMMDMGFARDVWSLHGEVYGHPKFPDGSKINPSTPVSFNEAKNELTTASGRRYKVVTFQTSPWSNKEKTIAQIRLDIIRGGYEVR